ncbi:hypothetical protein AKO1_001157, partial [Acrasis kona]
MKVHQSSLSTPMNFDQQQHSIKDRPRALKKADQNLSAFAGTGFNVHDYINKGEIAEKKETLQNANNLKNNLKDKVRNKIYLNYSKTKEAFRKLDKDADGVIDADEVQNGLLDLNIVASKKDIREMLPFGDNITYKDFSQVFAPDATSAETPYIKGERESSQSNERLNRSIVGGGATHDTFKSSIGFTFNHDLHDNRAPPVGGDDKNRSKSAPHLRGSAGHSMTRGHG